MTDDIVTRLQFLLEEGASIIKEQADEIERLRAEIELLRKHRDDWRNLANGFLRKDKQKHGW